MEEEPVLMYERPFYWLRLKVSLFQQNLDIILSPDRRSYGYGGGPVSLS